MLAYFRKQTKRTTSQHDHIEVEIVNRRTLPVLIRCEDSSFDYLQSFLVPPGESATEIIRKGVTICIWEQNDIIGEYIVKPDRSEDIVITVE